MEWTASPDEAVRLTVKQTLMGAWVWGCELNGMHVAGGNTGTDVAGAIAKATAAGQQAIDWRDEMVERAVAT